MDILSGSCMPDAVISPLVQETRESTVQPSKDVDVFSLPQKATSTKNFAVLLIRHFFEPHDLMDGMFEVLESLP